VAISDQLTAINNEKQALKTAIAAKGVNMTGVAFTDYHTKVGEITGGGSTPSYGWQPHPDWWDIKTILANDSQPGYTARYIFLLTDESSTIDFPGTGTALVGGTAWKTSDGQFYTAATTHTWNRSSDKACALGYKTRYVIVYQSDRDISISHRNLYSLYVYFGDCSITTAAFGDTTIPQNKILQSVGISSKTTCYSYTTFTFGYCQSLQSASIPSGVTTVKSSSFIYCYGLYEVTIPSSVTAISSSAFSYNLSLQSLTIPQSVTTIESNSFSNCSSLCSVNVYTNFDIALTLSASTHLTPSSMIALFTNLKDNTGGTAKTLTLGTTNLTKLTQDEKNIAINKNWNLA
jgi:hypothetical protein